MKPRILIADDHEIVREGIRTLLTRSRRQRQICDEAKNGEEAVQLVERAPAGRGCPRYTMPRLSGLQAAIQIAKLNLGCRILMFSMHDSGRLAAEVKTAGADG